MSRHDGDSRLHVSYGMSFRHVRWFGHGTLVMSGLGNNLSRRRHVETRICVLKKLILLQFSSSLLVVLKNEFQSLQGELID